MCLRVRDNSVSLIAAGVNRYFAAQSYPSSQRNPKVDMKERPPSGTESGSAPGMHAFPASSRLGER